MPNDKQDMAAVLRMAADDVEAGVDASHHIGAAAGIPPWLLTILQQAAQLYGPALLQAVQAWLAKVVPTPKPGG